MTQFGVAYIRTLLSVKLCDLVMRAGARSICACLVIQLVSMRDSNFLSIGVIWGSNLKGRSHSNTRCTKALAARRRGNGPDSKHLELLQRERRSRAYAILLGRNRYGEANLSFLQHAPRFQAKALHYRAKKYCRFHPSIRPSSSVAYRALI